MFIAIFSAPNLASLVRAAAVVEAATSKQFVPSNGGTSYTRTNPTSNHSSSCGADGHQSRECPEPRKPREERKKWGGPKQSYGGGGDNFGGAGGGSADWGTDQNAGADFNAGAW